MPRKKTAKDEAQPCLVPECQKEAKLRGLCPSCYQSARRLVAHGEVTWEELGRRGRARPTGEASHLTPFLRDHLAAKAEASQ